MQESAAAVMLPTNTATNQLVDRYVSTDFQHKTDFQWTDISSEAYRVYEFPDSDPVQIDKPLMLSVSKSGGHRVWDAQGVSHYIPAGWRHLYWKVHDGQPHFVK